ncbi:MAG TPA: rhodanese-like domain-containing protein [Chloroflexota bacterium]|nr:rhodanese-like domain-containing protein [Chloroflexota bacterium]
MNERKTRTWQNEIAASVLVLVTGLARLVIAGPDAAGAHPTEPWTAAEILQPAELASHLGEAGAPAVVYVGFKALYRPGHIPGAPLQGPTSEPQGLADLQRWATPLPRTTMVVIYCGCCPVDRCPNVRPAFTTLRKMGFTNLRVLWLPTSFEADWVKKGLPLEANETK